MIFWSHRAVVVLDGCSVGIATFEPCCLSRGFPVLYLPLLLVSFILKKVQCAVCVHQWRCIGCPVIVVYRIITYEVLCCTAQTRGEAIMAQSCLSAVRMRVSSTRRLHCKKPEQDKWENHPAAAASPDRHVREQNSPFPLCRRSCTSRPIGCFALPPARPSVRHSLQMVLCLSSPW